jgi:hypothetical protein
MFSIIRSILQLIFLTLALAITYPHGQAIWHSHTIGWGASFKAEWAEAWQPMLAGIVIVVVVFLVEIFFVIKQVKEDKELNIRRNRAFKTLEDIASKLGV